VPVKIQFKPETGAEQSPIPLGLEGAELERHEWVVNMLKHLSFLLSNRFFDGDAEMGVYLQRVSSFLLRKRPGQGFHYFTRGGQR